MRRSRNKKKWQFLPEILLAIFAIIFFISQIYSFNLNLTPEKITLKPISLVDAQTITESRKLNVCGDWPMINVELSASRGNPFNKKDEITTIAPSTSDAKCASFNQ
jgi:hypothetical protein